MICSPIIQPEVGLLFVFDIFLLEIFLKKLLCLYCSIETTWSAWQSIKTDIRQLDLWLTDMDKEVVNVQRSAGGQDVRPVQARLQELWDQLQSGLKELKGVNESYRALGRGQRADANGYIRSQVEMVNEHYDRCKDALQGALGRVKQLAALQEDFDDVRKQVRKSYCLYISCSFWKF